jgi:hypothetical protein
VSKKQKRPEIEFRPILLENAIWDGRIARRNATINPYILLWSSLPNKYAMKTAPVPTNMYGRLMVNSVNGMLNSL